MTAFTDAETKAEALRQENDYLRELLARVMTLLHSAEPSASFSPDTKAAWVASSHQLYRDIEKAIGEDDA